MKKIVLNISILLVTGFLAFCNGMTVNAKEEYTILEGIYADELDLSGLTAEEAKKKVYDYVAELGDKEVTLLTVDDKEVTVTMAELGLNWTNPGMIEEATSHARGGNFVQRYKAEKDLQESNVIYNIELSVDKEEIQAVIAEECSKYNIKEIDIVDMFKRTNHVETIVLLKNNN